MGTNADAAANAQANDHVANVVHVVPPEREIAHNIRDAIVGGTLVGHGVGENVHLDPLVLWNAPVARGVPYFPKLLGELINGRLAAYLVLLAVCLGGVLVGETD